MSGNLLAYYQQQMQPLMNQPSMLDGLAGMGGAVLGGYMQGQGDKTKREDRARKIAAEQAAAERQARQDARNEYTFIRGLGKGAAEGGSPVATLEGYQNAMRPLAEQLGLPVGPGIVGQPIDAYDWETKQQIVDKETPQAQGLLGQFLGAEPPKPIMVPQGNAVLDPRTKQPLFTNPLQARPLDPLTAELRQAQIGNVEARTDRTQAMPIGRARSGGGGSRGGRSSSGAKLQSKVGANGNFWTFNPATGEYTDTGTPAKADKPTAAPKPSPNIMTDRQIEAEARALANFESPQYGATPESKKALLDQHRQRLRAERDALRRAEAKANKPVKQGESPLLKRLREMP